MPRFSIGWSLFRALRNVELAMPETTICGTLACQLRIAGDLTLEFYKHITTRRYLLLDSEGHCYRQSGAGLEAVDVAVELKRVTGD